MSKFLRGVNKTKQNLCFEIKQNLCLCLMNTATDSMEYGKQAGSEARQTTSFLAFQLCGLGPVT